MTTGRTSWLLRRPEQTRTAFLELFFDLVFVVALFLLSHELLKHLSWIGALQTLVLLLAVLVVWFFVVLFTDTFDVRHPLIQLMVMSIMFCALVMAAAVPEAFGRRGLVFAGAYVTVRVGATAAGALLLRGHEAVRNALRLLFWFSMTASPWIVGAFLHGWARAALWMAALVVEYIAIGLGFPTPGLGRGGTRRIEVVVSEEHMAERYRLFFIIALGEPILVIGLTFSSGDFGPASGAATLVAFATTGLLWRIYIYRAGAMLSLAIAAARNPRRVAVLTIYAHVTMVAGIVSIAVGDDLVIQDPLVQTNPTRIVIVLGGPILFLAGRAAFEYAVFQRLPRPRVIGALTLIAITPAMRLVPALATAAAAALVLAGVAIADAVRTPTITLGAPSPPA
jgi:low temperature requirement protein LtrA